jgi:hypothetical protein
MIASAPAARSCPPGGEHVVGHGGQVADVDPVAVEVEPERLGEAFAQGQGGGAFGGVGEAHQLAQVQAPWVAWMSRSTPPAPIAASCWSSPMRRTEPPGR